MDFFLWLPQLLSINLRRNIWEEISELLPHQPQKIYQSCHACRVSVTYPTSSELLPHQPQKKYLSSSLNLREKSGMSRMWNFGDLPHLLDLTIRNVLFWRRMNTRVCVCVCVYVCVWEREREREREREGEEEWEGLHVLCGSHESLLFIIDGWGINGLQH